MTTWLSWLCLPRPQALNAAACCSWHYSHVSCDAATSFRVKPAAQITKPQSASNRARGPS